MLWILIGFIADPIPTLSSQKFKFLLEYTFIKVIKHTYVWYLGTKAFMKALGLFVKISRHFPCSKIRIRIPNTDPDLIRSAKSMLDPQHLLIRSYQFVKNHGPGVC